MEPSNITRMRSLQVHHLVQLQGDQQNRRAGVPLLDQLPVDVFDSAHVQPSGGLDRQQDIVFLTISRATMAFCWLPPDMLRVTVSSPSPLRMSKSVDQLIRIPVNLVVFRNRPLWNRGSKYCCSTRL